MDKQRTPSLQTPTAPASAQPTHAPSVRGGGPGNGARLERLGLGGAGEERVYGPGMGEGAAPRMTPASLLVDVLAGIKNPTYRLLVEHYMSGAGGTYELPYDVVDQMKPLRMNLIECDAFEERVEALRARGGGIERGLSFELSVGNDVLGEFTAKCTNVTLEVRKDMSWKAFGEHTWYDEWDFDAKEWGVRTRAAELTTRLVGPMLAGGVPFKIRTKPMSFFQTSDKPNATL